MTSPRSCERNTVSVNELIDTWRARNCSITLPKRNGLAPRKANSSTSSSTSTPRPNVMGPPAGSRRVTHFSLTINYDARLQTNPELIPPGLPTGGRMVYSGLAGLWRDCGGNPACPNP